MSPEQDNSATLFKRIQQISFSQLPYSKINKVLDAIVYFYILQIFQ